MYCFAFFPCFSDHLIFVSDFRQLSCRYFLKFFPFFIHCCICIWFVHCLKHRNKFAHKEVRQFSLYCAPLVLQGIAAGIGTSNFLRAFMINEVHHSQPSSIVKLGFFDSPLLFFFSFWPGCRLLLCQPLPRPCIPIWNFFVQYGESCESGPRI